MFAIQIGLRFEYILSIESFPKILFMQTGLLSKFYVYRCFAIIYLVWIMFSQLVPRVTLEEYYMTYLSLIYCLQESPLY